MIFELQYDYDIFNFKIIIKDLKVKRQYNNNNNKLSESSDL